MARIGVFLLKLCGGGTERVAARLSVIWQSAGHQVVFFTQNPPSESDFSHCCTQRIVYGGQSPAQIKALLKENRIDVCVYHDGWSDDVFAWIADSAKECGAKLIVINHHAFMNWAFFLCNVGDLFKSHLREKIDALVCVNPVQALWFHHQGFNSFCIANPLTFDVQANAGHTAGQETLIWVGRPNDPGKQLDVAIEVFAQVKRKVLGAQLLVIGEIRDSRRVERMLQRKGLQGSVSLLGYCADVRTYYEKAALHLFTSVVEAAPMVLAEVAAYGVPTVMLELPMCWDATRENGVVQVDNDDLEQMADECVRIVTDAAYAAALSAGARNWFAAKRGVDVGALWQELIESGKGAQTASSGPCFYKTEKNYDLLLKEVARAERFFVKTYWKRLGFVLSLERRWLRVRKMVIND